jgi:hypothetical protein
MRGAVLVRGAAGSGDQVMSYTDEDERRVRIELMQADIDNKRADTAYKRGLLHYEPWKVAFAAFGDGAAVTAALVALLSFQHDREGGADDRQRACGLYPRRVLSRMPKNTTTPFAAPPFSFKLRYRKELADVRP